MEKAEADRCCPNCGQTLKAIYSGPESGTFTSCECGPRPLVQSAPPLFIYIVATGITLTASLFIALR